MTQPPDLAPIVGCVVGNLGLDYRVSLNLASQDPPHYGERVDALLVIEAPFEIFRAGTRYNVDPSAVAGYERAVPLLHSTIEEAEVGQDQSLRIKFSGDQTVHVPRSPHYEAWQISGRGVSGWIAGPE
jgi:hypothetical protein